MRAVWILAALLLTTSSAAAEDPSFELRSAAFSHQDGIPREYTCEGKDLRPALAWTGVPEGTRSLALIVDDPDAPDPANPRVTWVHWVVYDLPVDAGGLAEGTASADLPAGAKSGLNDWKRPGYGGPCPPIGRHRYFFKLYALDVVLGDLGRPTKEELLAKIEGHVLAKAELVGTYEKAAR
jgi:Raf kinase inhibitor-like YbhB/YbcL family protein